MFSCRDLALAVLAMTLAGGGWAATPATTGAGTAPVSSPGVHYDGIGRGATDKEIGAWNIDVRPDFQGLPPGSGSVLKGQDVWESKCASCHGVFGESRQFFSPLVGGTTKEDVKTGHVARLKDTAYPERTMMMKLSTVSTLWDFINRAMPWTAPKSLSTDEVYAVVAYILNMASVLPDDFTLSDKNIAQVQQLIPNRNGMTTHHAMWPGKGLGGTSQPDVQGSHCMKDCAVETQVSSFLPDFARNAHGNLAEQNRLVGPQRGADTTQPPPKAAVGTLSTGMPRPAPATPAPAPVAKPAAIAVLQSNACVGCHAVDNKIVGPSFKEVAAKHGKRADALSYLTGKIRAGGSGVWGAIPMPAQNINEADAQTVAKWLIDGAPN
jgi:S-disulfanyl-L-cysteine oxidoreductase SoxD